MFTPSTVHSPLPPLQAVCQLEVDLLRDVREDQTPDGQPLVRLKFDYVNKTRQSRQYVLENGDECRVRRGFSLSVVKQRASRLLGVWGRSWTRDLPNLSCALSHVTSLRPVCRFMPG